jgi:hypothetical protein
MLDPVATARGSVRSGPSLVEWGHMLDPVATARGSVRSGDASSRLKPRTLLLSVCYTPLFDSAL